MTETISELRLSHIGIAVEDVEAARAKYAVLLGCTPSPVEEVASEGVRVSFFELDNCRVELLEGTSPHSPITKFLRAGRSGVHHIAFSPSEGKLATLLKSLQAEKVPVLDAAPRGGAEGAEVFFVHPHGAEGVLIEFVEQQKRAMS